MYQSKPNFTVETFNFQDTTTRHTSFART